MIPVVSRQQMLDTDDIRSVAKRFKSAQIVTGVFDKEHICAIHKHLFQDVYPDAGCVRTDNVFKSDGAVMDAKSLDRAFENFHARLKADGYLKRPFEHKVLAETLSGYFSDLNAMHPFYSGNGSVTRVVLSQLARNAGYHLDFSKTSQQDWANASRCAHNGRFIPMVSILDEGLSKLSSTRRLPSIDLHTDDRSSEVTLGA